MAQIRKILVPTDFSECADKALRHAAGLAQAFGAELVLLHVLTRWGTPTEAVLRTKSFPNLEDEIRKGSASQLDALKERHVPPPITCRIRLENGTPIGRILSVAVDEKADLIVIGTHGHGGLAHALLGSIAEKVVRQAQCPVLTVK